MNAGQIQTVVTHLLQAFHDPPTTSALVLRAEDLHGIAEYAGSLPGDWAVDPIADLRQPRTPRAWIHPVAGNPAPISFGFSRRDGLFHVLVLHRDDHDPAARQEVPYGNLRDAFAFLSTLLTVLVDRVSARIG